MIYRRSYEQFEQSVETVHNSSELSTGGVDNFKPTLSRFNNRLGISLRYSSPIRPTLAINNPQARLLQKVMNSFDSSTKTTIFN